MRSSQENQVSEYLEKLVSGASSHLVDFENQSRQAAEELGLGAISLSRGEAHVLRWVVASKSAKKAVEIGTLTGLSGLYILDGLMNGGKLWTLEKSPEHAEAANPILQKFSAKVGKNVEVVVGDARETLEKVCTEGPFDFIFIDGNKAAYGDYLSWAEVNLKKGGMLVADNVFLGGSVYASGESARFSDKQIAIMKKFNERLMDSSIWRGALLPTGEGLFVAEKI
jgi:predicted O-methyltransferase YrrM